MVRDLECLVVRDLDRTEVPSREFMVLALHPVAQAVLALPPDPLRALRPANTPVAVNAAASRVRKSSRRPKPKPGEVSPSEIRESVLPLTLSTPHARLALFPTMKSESSFLPTISHCKMLPTPPRLCTSLSFIDITNFGRNGQFIGGASNLLMNGQQFATCNQTIVDGYGYGQTCGSSCSYANIEIESGKTYLFRIVPLLF